MLVAHERTALQDAGLSNHIGGDGRVQTQWSDYAPLAQKVLDFAQELEAPDIETIFRKTR
jgi:hypothetical protein